MSTHTSDPASLDGAQTTAETSMANLSLAELYQRASARHGSRDGCLSPDELLDLVRGQLDAATRTAAVRHLADCSDCSKEYRAVQQHPSQEWPLQPAPRTDSVRPFNRTLHRWSTVAAAAGLLLTAAIAIWQTRFLSAGGDESGTLRSAAVSSSTAPEPSALLDEAPTALSWPSQDPSLDSAPQYRVRLFDSFGNILVDETLLGRSTWALNEETRAVLARGGRFLWTVDAPNQRVGPLWFEVIGQDPGAGDAPDALDLE